MAFDLMNTKLGYTNARAELAIDLILKRKKGRKKPIELLLLLVKNLSSKKPTKQTNNKRNITKIKSTFMTTTFDGN